MFEDQQRLLTALTQKLASKDIRIDKFRGYETEDINRWFEKLELQLEAKGIQTTDSAAISQVVNNLSGPAVTFMFELPSHERKDYANLKQALKRRYSTKDRTWVRRQRLVSRKQGQHEPVSDYINEMHELFSGLDMGEAEKVTYFTEGLHQALKVKVLERMPETLFEAEEIARTVVSISRRVNQPTNDDNLEKLLRSLLLQNQDKVSASYPEKPPADDNKLLGEIDRNNTVLAELTASLGKLSSPSGSTVKASSPTNIASLDGPPAVAVLNDSLGGNAGNSDAKIRHLEEMIQKLACDMDARMRDLAFMEPSDNPQDGSTARIAAFSEGNSHETPEFLEEIRRMERSFTTKLENLYHQVRRVDNRMNSLAHSNRSRERNRQSKPVCYKCGRVGHIQYNCHYNRPEEQYKNQEVRHEYRAYHNQEENQHREPESSARLYALDTHYARRVRGYRDKTESPGPDAQRPVSQDAFVD